MKFSFLPFLILLLFFDNLYCQEYDSLDVKEVEKYLISNPEKAYKLGLKIYDDNELDDNFRIRLLFSLLNVSNQTQRFNEAIRFGTEGLNLAEKSDNAVLQIKFLGVLGNIYQSLQVNDKTKYYLNKAEDLLKKNKLPSSQQNMRGNILYLKGMNYAYTLDCDMALSYFDQAISAYQSAKDPLSQININLAYLNKASCLIEMNNLKEAEICLNHSKINLSETDLLVNVPKSYADILNKSVEVGFAKILALKKEFQLSNEILFGVLKVQNQVNISDIENDIYFQLAQNFLKMKDIEKSNYYNALHEKKSMEKNKIQVEILNNLLLQEQKASQQKILNQNRKIVKWSIALGFIFSVITFVFILSFKKISKRNQIAGKDLYGLDS